MWREIKQLFLSFFWRRVVLIGPREYQFDYCNGNVIISNDNNKNITPLIGILDRECYFETNTTLPPVSFIEALKLKKNITPNSPFKGEKISYLQSVNSTWVLNSSVIKDDFQKSISERKLKFILPLTWLFNSREQVSEYHICDTEFVFCENNNIKSSIPINRSMGKDHATMLRSWLWENNRKGIDHVYDTDSSLNIMASGFMNLTKLQLLSVMTSNPFLTFHISWKKIVKSCLVIIFVYFLFLTAMLKVSDLVLLDKKEDLITKANPIIQKRNELNKLRISYDNKLSIVSSIPLSWKAWMGIVNVKGLIIKRVVILDNKVELYAISRSSSKVLSQLNEIDDVISPTFTKPVINNRGLETFVISWEFPIKQPVIQIDEASSNE